MTDHPLTETAAAELWDTHAADTVPWDDWYGGSRRALTAMLRAAFDAGSVHATNNLRDTPAGQALMAEAKREVAYGLECLATGYDLSCHWEAARSARAAAKSLLEAFPKEDNR